MVISHEKLNVLSDVQFEKLIKTLLLSVIGNGVTPFSQGKDGAREAIYFGKANYPSKSNNWEGNWIFQVKYSNISFGLDKARNQVKYSIDSELNKLKDYGYLESNKCDNYIFITNVPFSGQADKGLHDYISKKKLEYKVKNFDYWDGEKVIGFLNSNPAVRETFFPNLGIELVDENLLLEVNSTFVKPNLYDQLKDELLSNKIINIVGQPHVGKSFLALFLANDILETRQLNEIVLIPIIDNLQVIPKLINCVIIFDDLYGDLNYDSIGKQTKIVSTLSKENYVIITSRDYIFQEAVEGKELLSDREFKINQEGSYSDNQLENILFNHLRLNFPVNKENGKVYDFITKNKFQIVRELRFPHNIQLFATIVDRTVATKKILLDKISKAKTIDNLIITWVSQQPEISRNMLLALAIGKIQSVSILENVCKMQWNYDKNIIDNCLIENRRMLYYDTSNIRYKHPSFKTAIVNYFFANYRLQITDLILNVILNLPGKERRAINKSLAYQIIEELDVSQLSNILQNKLINGNFLEIIWLNIIRKNNIHALELLISLMDGTKRANRYFKGFVASKSFMKDKEIMSLINFLMTQRYLNELVDRLIEYFAYKIRLSIRPIVDSLSYKIPKDFSLKIKLLGCIGTIYPDLVIHELNSFGYEQSVTARRQVYAALNMLHHSSKEHLENIIPELIQRETNQINIKKLNNILKRIRS
jgi:hypothetical protein